MPLKFKRRLFANGKVVSSNLTEIIVCWTKFSKKLIDLQLESSPSAHSEFPIEDIRLNFRTSRFASRGKALEESKMAKW